MKNFKQIAFGVLVCALAISFSAFNNANGHSLKVTKDSKGRLLFTERYFRAAPGGHDTSPADYIYSSSPNANCLSSSDVCSAEFTTSNPPVNGDAPSGSPAYVTGSDASGDWNGN
ncbi:hypothetical protein [Mucilaginibacter sp. L196]|uniref:hypothetical protein n=1 Tax=Mucilaginibacter sp. L196 TaxID=1641870 RepID=UPI00131C1B2C|nr:hypothetical protein [Mucilaginibacter sp. L196]